jgi:hypothetical protein
MEKWNIGDVVNKLAAASLGPPKYGEAGEDGTKGMKVLSGNFDDHVTRSPSFLKTRRSPGWLQIVTMLSSFSYKQSHARTFHDIILLVRLRRSR